MTRFTAIAVAVKGPLSPVLIALIAFILSLLLLPALYDSAVFGSSSTISKTQLQAIYSRNNQTRALMASQSSFDESCECFLPSVAYPHLASNLKAALKAAGVKGTVEYHDNQGHVVADDTEFFHSPLIVVKTEPVNRRVSHGLAVHLTLGPCDSDALLLAHAIPYLLDPAISHDTAFIISPDPLHGMLSAVRRVPELTQVTRVIHLTLHGLGRLLVSATPTSADSLSAIPIPVTTALAETADLISAMGMNTPSMAAGLVRPADGLDVLVGPGADLGRVISQFKTLLKSTPVTANPTAAAIPTLWPSFAVRIDLLRSFAWTSLIICLVSVILQFRRHPWVLVDSMYSVTSALTFLPLSCGVSALALVGVSVAPAPAALAAAAVQLACMALLPRSTQPKAAIAATRAAMAVLGVLLSYSAPALALLLIPTLVAHGLGDIVTLAAQVAGARLSVYSRLAMAVVFPAATAASVVVSLPHDLVGRPAVLVTTVACIAGVVVVFPLLPVVLSIRAPWRASFALIVASLIAVWLTSSRVDPLTRVNPDFDLTLTVDCDSTDCTIQTTLDPPIAAPVTISAKFEATGGLVTLPVQSSASLMDRHPQRLQRSVEKFVASVQTGGPAAGVPFRTNAAGLVVRVEAEAVVPGLGRSVAVASAMVRIK
ncbi:hypothetical protein J8273_8942 [Carpediemonas membranifera]|uniref:Uncharacterized protein n=1 Tax=Carpediemonas membranifera TaxID=201153 RepID=A0A8J6AW12_9EUKA|nr:hypothetical protein J8273_8942 [Carpediemonas membranifera]|eukprot:KAG9389643.1 hypothetical protein J8273_8942 [Carpediemonas membranifera]